MAEDGIIREREGQEKSLKEGGFLDLRQWRDTNPTQLALKKIDEVETEFFYKKRQPFCHKCAFKAVDEKIKSINEMIKNADKDTTQIKVDFNIDFKKFGGEDKFNLIGTDEIQGPEYKGSNKHVKKGIYKNFVCKTCRAPLSMQFENEELEATKK